MENILNYFETIPSLHRTLILVFTLSFFWRIEGVFPLFTNKYLKWNHAKANLMLTLTTIMVNFSLAFFLLKTADWVYSNEFGILNWFPEIPLAYFVLLGILLLDFVGAYLPHFLEHKIKPLWMIHLVHHTDPNVDITTATRHHPLESLLRYFFTLLGVFLIGLPISVVMLYQSISLFFTQFNHANIKLPNSLDLLLSYIIVTPGMHKTHHHYKLPFTDSNYGNIFSIWDRLFGTYKFRDQDNVVYGVDTFPDKEKNIKFNILLKQPFQQYRKPTTDKEGNLI